MSSTTTQTTTSLADGLRLGTLLRAELVTLIDVARYNPVVDLGVFPNTPAEFFWGSTSSADSGEDGLDVSFYTGYVDFQNKGTVRRVRCVRTAP